MPYPPLYRPGRSRSATSEAISRATTMVQLVSSNPNLLHRDDMADTVKWLKSLGAKIPAHSGNPSLLLRLPACVLREHILPYITLHDIVQLRMVSKSLCNAIDSNKAVKKAWMRHLSVSKIDAVALRFRWTHMLAPRHSDVEGAMATALRENNTDFIQWMTTKPYIEDKMCLSKLALSAAGSASTLDNLLKLVKGTPSKDTLMVTFRTYCLNGKEEQAKFLAQKFNLDLGEVFEGHEAELKVAFATGPPKFASWLQGFINYSPSSDEAHQLFRELLSDNPVMAEWFRETFSLALDINGVVTHIRSLCLHNRGTPQKVLKAILFYKKHFRFPAQVISAQVFSFLSSVKLKAKYKEAAAAVLKWCISFGLKNVEEVYRNREECMRAVCMIGSISMLKLLKKRFGILPNSAQMITLCDAHLDLDDVKWLMGSKSFDRRFLLTSSGQKCLEKLACQGNLTAIMSIHKRLKIPSNYVTGSTGIFVQAAGARQLEVCKWLLPRFPVDMERDMFDAMRSHDITVGVRDALRELGSQLFTEWDEVGPPASPIYDEYYDSYEDDLYFW